MTADEVTKLVEAEVRKARLPGEAEREAFRLLETVSLKKESKQYIVETVLRGSIPTKDGAFDVEAFGKLVATEAGRFAGALGSEGAKVQHMGIPGVAAPAQPKPEEIAALEAQAKRDEGDAIAIFESLGQSPSGAKFAAKGRAA